MGMAAKQTEPEVKRLHENPIDLGRGISARVIEVTPRMAETWLKKNHPDNRAIRNEHVQALVRDMNAGNWRLTHQAVAFDDEGFLIDGQHRLEAIRQSGVACLMLVVWNSVSQFHDPIDRGRTRSLSMLSGIAGKDVAALRVLRTLSDGFTQKVPITLAEVDELHGRYGEALKELKDRVGISSRRMTGGVIAACAWAIPVYREAVFEFAKEVATGEMIARGHPAFAFRGWQDGNPRESAENTAYAAMSCIVFHATGQSMSRVYVAQAGYRDITAKRRVKKVPYTPSAQIVPAEARGPAA